ncbi:hypothetical protein ACIBBB_26020 [Streptomyces sp. NPDC051217]|uniref:hypothetical protein n=1 Tax=Streptomyces sp. NPDC051217 TaxID=3365644 RepID=UPI00378EBA6B
MTEQIGEGDETMDPGDGDFEAFVSARGPRLLRVAWLLTGDAHLAEDLLRTTLAEVWPRWHRISGERPEGVRTPDPPTLPAPAEPSVLCRKLMGTEEYSVLLAGPGPAGDIGIQVSVCAAGAGASSPILGDVRAMIAGADCPASGLYPEPSRAPTTHAQETGGTDAHAN